MKPKACSIIHPLSLPPPRPHSFSRSCYFRPVSVLSLTTAGSSDLHPAPPSMCNISLNLLFIHWRKYQEVSLNESSTTRRLTGLPEGFCSIVEITGCQRETALKLPLAAPRVPGLDQFLLDYFHGKLFLSHLKSFFVSKEWGCILGMIWYFKRCFL